MNGAALIMCATLVAVDGDTIKCDGMNMRAMVTAPLSFQVSTPRKPGSGIARLSWNLAEKLRLACRICWIRRA